MKKEGLDPIAKMEGILKDILVALFMGEIHFDHPNDFQLESQKRMSENITMEEIKIAQVELQNTEIKPLERKEILRVVAAYNKAIFNPSIRKMRKSIMDHLNEKGIEDLKGIKKGYRDALAKRYKSTLREIQVAEISEEEKSDYSITESIGYESAVLNPVIYLLFKEQDSVRKQAEYLFGKHKEAYDLIRDAHEHLIKTRYRIQLGNLKNIISLVTSSNENLKEKKIIEFMEMLLIE